MNDPRKRGRYNLCLEIKNTDQLEKVFNAMKQKALECLPGGALILELRRLNKTRLQEEKYHAMMGDIAASVVLDGMRFDQETWKALLIDEFEQEMLLQGLPLRHPSLVVLSLDKKRAVTIRASSRRFLKIEACNFIEYLYSFGTQHGAVFSEKSLAIYEECLQYKRAKLKQ